MDGRKRVLLADSSEEFRWLMWRSAANHNFFSLATVGSGRDVLLCMQKQTADLLLMDTALPDVCGLTVLDELQRRGTAPQRVILLSSIVSEQVTDQAFAGRLTFYSKAVSYRSAVWCHVRTVSRLFLRSLAA